ncbi:MAG: hypothetical protein Q7W30_03885 [Coriobacteriia bacterium]|nr:hypothetical protein [Coriobacteriia bacterium]
MGKPSREHHSDEFGQLPSSGIKGLDAPMIGAAVNITLDGIVERESGVTPSPPTVSVNALVIALVVMFLLGAAIAVYVLWFAPPPDYRGLEFGAAARVGSALQSDASTVVAPMPRS